MNANSATRRRLVGGSCLGLALIMLVAGQTALKDRLPTGWFLLFWLVCVLLTSVAMVTAIRDARELLRNNREEHRELIKTTIERIESETRSRSDADRDA